jgi:nitrite reductase (cytochrome c-552)
MPLRPLLITGAVAAVVAIGLALLLTNILEHKAEARNPFYRVVALTDTTTDPAVWGKNFPLHYDDYLKTVDQSRTRYGGSEAIERAPSEGDPRTVVSQSRLEEDPRLVRLWAGYAFSKDFREERGHAYMLADQEFTGRQQSVQQPGTCLNCHASMHAAYVRAGRGDIVAGFDSLNSLTYQMARQEATHPVSCVDCHDAETMQLRITRPAFMTGIAHVKRLEGTDGFDVNRDATRQEMRTYVCAQCHVEYYFADKKRLTYPWARGLLADSMLAHYDSVGHTDWTHATSGTPALKAQHPEFEMHSQGTHGRAGVTCADCHMPYKREGAMKVSDHHVQSPMLNVNRACQTCHKASEAELQARVATIQGRTFQLRGTAMDAVLALTDDIARIARADSAHAALGPARTHQRHAQFLLDFVEAENSQGFHAPQEAARLLANAINHARLGQAVIRGDGSAPVVSEAPGDPRERKLRAVVKGGSGIKQAAF